MGQLFQAGQLLQGVVSNCNQRVESTTSGKITTTAFTRRVEGSINTTHNCYTTFDIGNMSFTLAGGYPLRDGDEVVCYAIKIGPYYLVETLKNVTRNYSIRDRFGSLWWYYLGIISGILSACVAIVATFFAIMIIYSEYISYIPYIIVVVVASSSWSFISFKGIKIVKRKDKQNNRKLQSPLNTG